MVEADSRPHLAELPRLFVDPSLHERQLGELNRGGEARGTGADDGDP